MNRTEATQQKLLVSLAVALTMLVGEGFARASQPARGPEPKTSRALSSGDSDLHLRVDAELGFLSPVAHTVQFSTDGSEIDYVEEGGQDVLFSFNRYAGQLRWAERHVATLLYQPLLLETRAIASRDLTVDGAVFSEGTPLSLVYSFPFWRAGYAYSVVKTEFWDVRLGGALQIRNARIEFEALGGDQFRANRDVGPVPLLHAFAQRSLGDSAFVEAEVDGFYAPVKYINGGKSDVVGAIWDASLRAGLMTRYDTEAFINLRYLGGGAEGTSDDDGPGDGFTSNWLHFISISVGGRLNLL